MNKFTFTASVCAALFFAACGDDSSSATSPSEGSSSSVANFSSSSSAIIPGLTENHQTDLCYINCCTDIGPSPSVIPGLTVKLLTDSRDGQMYKVVTIGAQTWMAQNLNYETADSYCYSDTPSNCTKYGRLYTWAAAMDSAGKWSTNGKGCGNGSTCTPMYPVRGVCPTGWHLPTKAEFETLFTAVGGQSIAGRRLKSYSDDWNVCGFGTDVYWFSALPAGYRYDIGDYDDKGNYAYFWSSTEDGGYHAYHIYLEFSFESVSHDDEFKFKDFGLSVRCVKDE